MSSLRTRPSPVDASLVRIETARFACPLGVYPVDQASFAPKQGYVIEFEPGESEAEAGEWEAWPDRWMFDIVITQARMDALCRSLWSLLPGRVHPMLDVLGRDAYREIDPYVAYDAVGIERFVDAVRRRRAWLMEDGLVGFGAMSIDPFVYVYLDEHKILTVRVQTDLRERVERILRSFDLEPTNAVAGVDSFGHEHRGVLRAAAENGEARPLRHDEIIEELIDEWRLTLNVDADANATPEGDELGVTGWRCVVRGIDEEDDRPRRAVLLTAGSLAEAERIAVDAVARESRGDDPEEDDDASAEDEESPDCSWSVLFADRLTDETLAAELGAAAAPALDPPRALLVEALAEGES